GSYTVSVKVNGCFGASSPFSISQYPDPVINLGNDTVICASTWLTLSVPSGFQSYLWQDGSTDTTFNLNADGTYYVTVSDGYCSSTDSIDITTRSCALVTANFTTAQTNLCQHTCIDFTDMSQNADTWE